MIIDGQQYNKKLNETHKNTTRSYSLHLHDTMKFFCAIHIIVIIYMLLIYSIHLVILDLRYFYLM